MVTKAAKLTTNNAKQVPAGFLLERGCRVIPLSVSPNISPVASMSVLCSLLRRFSSAKGRESMCAIGQEHLRYVSLEWQHHNHLSKLEDEYLLQTLFQETVSTLVTDTTDCTVSFSVVPTVQGLKFSKVLISHRASH